MPKVHFNRDGKTGKIVWGPEDWLAGLDPQFDAVADGENVTGQMPQARAMNPYRFLGNLSPGFQAADIANVSAVSAFLKKAVVNSTNAYAVSADEKLHRIDTLNGTPSITNAGAWPHTIDHAHASEVGYDTALYTHKVGGTSALRLLYSFADATDWDVGTYDFSATFDDDFMSTAPATPLAAPYLAGGVGFPHPIMVGDDDIAYLGDRNFLHGYDGQNAADTDGKFFPAVLTLPSNYVMTCFTKYAQYMVIFAYQPSASGSYYSGDARAFFWDYLSLDFTYSKSLNDNYVSEAFEYDGTIGCFTYGRPLDPSTGSNTKLTKLQIFDGSKFVVIPEAAVDKNPPGRGGVDVQGKIIRWNSQGTVYQYGSIGQGIPQVLNQVGEGQSTQSGLFGILNRTTFISTGATTTGGCQTLSENYFSTPLIRGALAKPEFPEYMKGKMTSVKVKYAKTSTGGRAIILTMRDRIGDVSTIISPSDALQSITSANLVTEYKLDSTGNPLGSFDALRPVVSYESGAGATDAPIINRIEVEFELINI